MSIYKVSKLFLQLDVKMFYNKKYSDLIPEYYPFFGATTFSFIVVG
jgi:hypothetical protein